MRSFTRSRWLKSPCCHLCSGRAPPAGAGSEDGQTSGLLLRGSLLWLGAPAHAPGQDFYTHSLHSEPNDAHGVGALSQRKSKRLIITRRFFNVCLFESRAPLPCDDLATGGRGERKGPQGRLLIHHDRRLFHHGQLSGYSLP